jgi:hypothetical protein
VKPEIFLRLNDNFALGADELQWILYRARQKDVPLTMPLRHRDWKPVSFVDSTKEILFRCMRENGCLAGTEARAALDGLISTFKAWKAAQSSRNGHSTPHPWPQKPANSDHSATTLLEPELADSGP